MTDLISQNTIIGVRVQLHTKDKSDHLVGPCKLNWGECHKYENQRKNQVFSSRLTYSNSTFHIYIHKDGSEEKLCKDRSTGLTLKCEGLWLWRMFSFFLRCISEVTQLASHPPGWISNSNFSKTLFFSFPILAITRQIFKWKEFGGEHTEKKDD